MVERGASTASALSRRRPRILLALGWYAEALHHGVTSYAYRAGWSLNIDMERRGRPGVIPDA
jgi:hypothetical protein